MNSISKQWVLAACLLGLVANLSAGVAKEIKLETGTGIDYESQGNFESVRENRRNPHQKANQASDVHLGDSDDFGKPSETKSSTSALEKKVAGGLPKDIGEWVKLIFNPIELVKAICVHFKLDLEKFTALVGKGMVFGVEALLTPLVITMKIIEKVFVPDACRLRFICKMGTHLEFIKEHVLKFSSNFLEGSSQIKAFSDGIVGRDCESAFPSCANGGELKLKKPFEELKAESGVAKMLKLE